MRVLVVDDEPAVREALARSLRFEGYEVAQAHDGLGAVEFLMSAGDQRPLPDVVIMDVLMPRLDGLGAVRRIRAAGMDIPILVLTARDATPDRVAGLDAGADDYLVKPFALEELLARLRALLRRTAISETEQTLAYEDLTLDPGTREVIRSGHHIQLTRTEFSLLELLLRHPRQVLTRAQILDEVWGYDFGTTGNALEVYVGYLRRKTEVEGLPRLIQTVRGVGYALRLEP